MLTNSQTNIQYIAQYTGELLSEELQIMMVRIPPFARTMLKLGFGRGKIVEAHEKMMQAVTQRP